MASLQPRSARIARSFSPRSGGNSTWNTAWRCGCCGQHVPESRIRWGAADQGSPLVCLRCRPLPAPLRSPRPLAPRSPRRLAPLVPPGPASLPARRSPRVQPSSPRSGSPMGPALTTGNGRRCRVASRLNAGGGRDDSAATLARRRDPRPRAMQHAENVFFAPKLERPVLNELLQTTNMTRTELYKLFSRFKALCQLSGTPGSIDKKTFKEGVSSLAFEDDAFVDRVFALLDEDGSGTVEWEEFVNAVNSLETGSTFDKLKFCFEVYDRDGNQSIEREELQDMFTSMLLNGESVTMDEISPEMRELIVDFVDGIYDTFDADHSESLEFDEVMQALQKSPEIDVWEVFGRTLINSS